VHAKEDFLCIPKCLVYYTAEMYMYVCTHIVKQPNKQWLVQFLGVLHA